MLDPLLRPNRSVSSNDGIKPSVSFVNNAPASPSVIPVIVDSGKADQPSQGTQFDAVGPVTLTRAEDTPI
jgi:hypothetical protein